MTTAAGFTVTGAQGVCWLIALILFAIAAIAAWFAPSKIWPVLVAAGLFFAALAHLIT